MDRKFFLTQIKDLFQGIFNDSTSTPNERVVEIMIIGIIIIPEIFFYSGPKTDKHFCAMEKTSGRAENDVLGG